MEIVLYIIIGVVIGGIIGYLVVKSNGSNDSARVSLLEEENNRLKQEGTAKDERIARFSSEITTIMSAREVFRAKVEHLSSLLNSEKEDKERIVAEHKEELQNQATATKEQLASANEQAERNLNDVKNQFVSQLDSQKKQFESQIESSKKHYEQQLMEMKEQYAKQLKDLKAQQTEQMELQMNLIKEQMNTASEKILRERSEQLSEKNKEALASILNPLKDGISQMKVAVEKSDQEHKETMVRLDATIKHSIEQSREVGERADKLAQALTGENKTQGNFGELRLKQLLEDMGLEEGSQFEEQTTMRDSSGRAIYDEEDGHRMIPDIILHFPDERDVIIDSKMSFKAFEDYHNAENDIQRQDALTRHIASVRQHVNELSRKNYSAYIKEGRGKLDFVLMYVFSESALQLALMNEPTLWKEAYDKGVIITGSQNLYMMLRVLEMTWRQVRQIENQEQMMRTANMVVDRVQMFYERFMKVDEMLEKTKKAFDDVKSVTGPSGQSIEVAAKNLVKYGAKQNPKRKYQLKNTDEDVLSLGEDQDIS